tara:strand:- start:387 stop:1502 length:1116 start_codon:yes stop_codon:yes gene_type:complete
MANSTDWARAIGTTIVNYLREEELTTFRKFKVFAALEASGNVMMNQAGLGLNWQVRYRNQPVTGNNGETPRVFARQNLWVDANLPYRGYQVTDSIYKREMLENRGQQALIDVAGKMASRLQESMEQHLAKEVWVDGNEAGNELRFHGIESMMANNGTVNINDGTQRAANAEDMFGYPADSYAGVNTGLGAVAGSQLEGVWPNGVADPEYDFYSPIIVNYLSTNFGNGGGGWTDTCVVSTREGIQQAKRNDTRESQIDMVILDRRLFIDYMNTLDSKERTIVTKQNGLKSYGFNDVFEQDGVEISTEYAVPDNTGYGLSIANMELRCMEGSLMTAEGPFYNEDTQAYRYVVSVLANLKFKSPRNFFKLAPLA